MCDLSESVCESVPEIGNFCHAFKALKTLTFLALLCVSRCVSRSVCYSVLSVCDIGKHKLS